jgi:integrase/recombinase XerC
VRDGDRAELASLLASYQLTFRKRGKPVSEHTLAAYRRGLDALLEFCSSQGLMVHQLRHQEAQRYTRHLEASGLAPASINQRLAAARAVMRALEWAGLVDRDPFARVSVADTDPREKVQPFSRDEVRALLDVADARLTAIVLLGAHCGLRVTEMAGLEWPDLDLAVGTLTVRQGKGRKRRSLDLTPQAVEALRTLRTPASTGPVFGVSTRRLQDAFTRLCRRAGVEGKGVHALRHTCGTELYRLTRDLKLVARHLGHSSTRPTEIYAHLASEDYSAGVRALGEAIWAA